jgi:ribonuclease Z
MEKKKPRRLILEAVKENNIPLHFYERLKQGEHFVSSAGEVIRNEWLTEPAPKGKSYAFCADTKYNEEMIQHIQDVDMIYHETTYLDNFRDRAEERFHSTTRQAAMIAQKAQNRRLLIGHFSSKYDTLGEFESEAREIFPNTELALEGVTYRV